MAAWSDRDPRWIVEERVDGQNVNGWHWQESNKLEWAKTRLYELLVGLEAAQGGVRVVELKEVTGEALITIRKGNKKFACYDLTLTLAWQAPHEEEPGKQVNGTIQLDDFTATNDPEDYQYSVMVEGGSGPVQERCKACAVGMKEQVLERLQQFVADMGAL